MAMALALKNGRMQPKIPCGLLADQRSRTNDGRAMMRFRMQPQVMSCLLMSCCLVFWFGGRCFAVNPDSVARLGEMKRRITELEISGDKSKPKFATEPLFRYSDPTRGVTDATMWRLGEKGRPAAILILENYRTSKLPWSYELTITSDNVPTSIASPGWKWHPDPKHHQWLRIQDVEPPSAQATRRTQQEKQLVRNFRTTEEWESKTFELRLLPKPIATYADEKNGILNGSIYVFAHGTNSELLLLLEAAKESGSTFWRVSFVRAGSARFEVRFDGKIFWNIGFDDSKSGHYMIGLVEEAANGKPATEKKP